MSALVENKKMYDKLLNDFKKSPSHGKAQKLIRYTLKNPTGIYAFKELEEYYIAQAKAKCQSEKTPISIAESADAPLTYLHVLTEAYKTGGHTRVVERWLEASDDRERHSVCLLNQKNKEHIPALIRDNVENRNGDLIEFDTESSLEDKAVKLYELACDYSYVVLHSHPEDPVPLMAFSFQALNPRIILFNHAGHLPWLGVNVVDLALSHEYLQGEVCKYVRGCKKNMLVDLVIDESVAQSSLAKEKARQSIGLSERECAIVTMAGSHKYNPIDGYHFVHDLDKVLSANESTVFLGIGIGKDLPLWEGIKQKYGEARVRLLGAIPYSDVEQYLVAADIYLDSFPTHSWTSIIDAIWVGKLPVVARRSPCGVMPFMEGSSAVKDTAQEWVERILELAKSEQERSALAENLSQLAQKNCGHAFFREQMRSIHESWEDLEDDFTEPFRADKVEEHDLYRCALADASFGKGKLGRLKTKWMNSLRKRLPF